MNSTLFLGFWLLLTFFTAYFEDFKRLIESPKTKLLSSFRNHFNIEKDQPYLLICFLVSKYIFFTVFWHFNLKMHQPELFWFSLHSNYTKRTLFYCL